MNPLYQILISVLLGAFGQIFLKAGVLQANVAGGGTVLTRFYRIFMVPHVWAGLVLYIISSLIWLLVLSRVQLSFAYPLISIGYITVFLLSWLIFKESISLMRCGGMLLICLGVLMIARS